MFLSLFRSPKQKVVGEKPHWTLQGTGDVDMTYEKDRQEHAITCNREIERATALIINIDLEW